MIYAAMKYSKSESINDHLFYSWPEYHSATFNPDIEIICLIELGRLHGKTYSEKKADIESKAIEFSNNQYGGLSYSELADIESYFERYGRRYGLLKDFHENVIC